MPTSKRKNKKGLYRNRRTLSMQCPNPAALGRLARRLLRLPDRLWLIRGPLGAGKTTLVRAALRQLGVRQRVTSPTFTLVKIYPLRRGAWRRAVHIDAYRLKGAHEQAALGIDEAVQDVRALVMIEWPERLTGRRWPGAIRIQLRHVPDGRRVTVRGQRL